jgi:hypothetical protein
MRFAEVAGSIGRVRSVGFRLRYGVMRHRCLNGFGCGGQWFRGGFGLVGGGPWSTDPATATATTAAAVTRAAAGAARGGRQIQI